MLVPEALLLQEEHISSAAGGRRFGWAGQRWGPGGWAAVGGARADGTGRGGFGECVRRRGWRGGFIDAWGGAGKPRGRDEQESPVRGRGGGNNIIRWIDLIQRIRSVQRSKILFIYIYIYEFHPQFLSYPPISPPTNLPLTSLYTLILSSFISFTHLSSEDISSPSNLWIPSTNLLQLPPLSYKSSFHTSSPGFPSPSFSLWCLSSLLLPQSIDIDICIINNCECCVSECLSVWMACIKVFECQ